MCNNHILPLTSIKFWFHIYMYIHYIFLFSVFAAESVIGYKQGWHTGPTFITGIESNHKPSKIFNYIVEKFP